MNQSKIFPVYICIVENDIKKEDVLILNSYEDGGVGSLGDLDLHNRLMNQPKVYIGHASFEAAIKTNNITKYVPRTINRITHVLKNSCGVINDEFIDMIEKAFSHKNNSLYNVADSKTVLGFLQCHKNKECFIIIGGPEPNEMGGQIEHDQKEI